MGLYPGRGRRGFRSWPGQLRRDDRVGFGELIVVARQLMQPRRMGQQTLHMADALSGAVALRFQPAAQFTVKRRSLEPAPQRIALLFHIAAQRHVPLKCLVELIGPHADPTIDTRVGSTVPAYEQALKAAHIKYELYYYKGANHAFNDDTQSARYDEAAAKLAWQRTLELFKTNLA